MKNESQTRKFDLLTAREHHITLSNVFFVRHCIIYNNIILFFFLLFLASATKVISLYINIYVFTLYICHCEFDFF